MKSGNQIHLSIYVALFVAFPVFVAAWLHDNSIPAPQIDSCFYVKPKIENKTITELMILFIGEYLN